MRVFTEVQSSSQLKLRPSDPPKKLLLLLLHRSFRCRAGGCPLPHCHCQYRNDASIAILEWGLNAPIEKIWPAARTASLIAFVAMFDHLSLHIDFDMWWTVCKHNFHTFQNSDIAVGVLLLIVAVAIVPFLLHFLTCAFLYREQNLK